VLTEYQQQLRAKYLSAPLVGPSEPWRAMDGPWPYVPVGGLQGVGFGVHPETGDDLLMVVSIDGFGLLETATGTKIARIGQDPPHEEPAGHRDDPGDNRYDLRASSPLHPGGRQPTPGGASGSFAGR
jgi:hypothetical protein